MSSDPADVRGAEVDIAGVVVERVFEGGSGVEQIPSCGVQHSLYNGYTIVINQATKWNPLYNSIGVTCEHTFIIYGLETFEKMKWLF